MPALTRYFIRTAFAFLIFGTVLLMFSEKYRNFFPTALHFITLGWITNIIFGVAFWMFPKRKYFGNTIPLISFLLMNIGLIMRLFSEPFGISFLFPLSSFMQFLSALLFAFHILRRIT